MQTSPLLERLGVELPIVQAGMGGGLSRSKLAAAVSEAGGLGTLGMLDPAALAGDLDRTREPAAPWPSTCSCPSLAPSTGAWPSAPT